MGAVFLQPDPKSFDPGTAGLAGRQKMSARTEMAIDHAVLREEPLGMSG